MAPKSRDEYGSGTWTQVGDRSYFKPDPAPIILDQNGRDSRYGSFFDAPQAGGRGRLGGGKAPLGGSFLDKRDPYWDKFGTTDTGIAKPKAPYEGVRYTGSAVDRAIQRRNQEKAILDLVDTNSRKDKIGISRARQVLMEKYNFSAKTLETLTAKIGDKQTGAKSAREAQDMGRAFLRDNDMANAKRAQDEAPEQAEAPQGRGNAPAGATIIGKNWFQNVGGTVKSGTVDFSGKTEAQGTEEPPKGGEAPAAAKAYQFGFTNESLSKSEWSKGAVASPNRISHAWGNGPQGISQRLLSGAALDAFKKEHPEAAKALGDGATAAQIDFRPVIGRDGKTSKWVASATPFDMEKHIADQAAKTQTHAAAKNLMDVFNATNQEAPLPGETPLARALAERVGSRDPESWDDERSIARRNIGVDPSNPNMRVITFNDKGTAAYRDAVGDKTLFQRGTVDQREQYISQRRSRWDHASPEEVNAYYDRQAGLIKNRAAETAGDAEPILDADAELQVDTYAAALPSKVKVKPLPLLRQASDALKRFSPF